MFGVGIHFGTDLAGDVEKTAQATLDALDIIAARLANAQPIIIATKTDIESSQKLSDMYQALDIPVFSINKTSALEELLDVLENKTTVLIGPSGVGKSTLVNRLVPDANRRTGEVNDVTGQGKHTSTSAFALKINKSTWIIDTPGIRSFALANLAAIIVLSINLGLLIPQEFDLLD